MMKMNNKHGNGVYEADNKSISLKKIQKTMILTKTCRPPPPPLLVHFPLHLKKVSHLKKYTKECVTLRQNKPKWAKILRPLRKKYTGLKKEHHRRC